MNPTAGAAVIIAAIVLFLIISGKYKGVSNVLGITAGPAPAVTKNQSTKPPATG